MLKYCLCTYIFVEKVLKNTNFPLIKATPKIKHIFSWNSTRWIVSSTFFTILFYQVTFYFKIHYSLQNVCWILFSYFYIPKELAILAITLQSKSSLSSFAAEATNLILISDWYFNKYSKLLLRKLSQFRYIFERLETLVWFKWKYIFSFKKHF